MSVTVQKAREDVTPEEVRERAERHVEERGVSLAYALRREIEEAQERQEKAWKAMYAARGDDGRLPEGAEREAWRREIGAVEAGWTALTDYAREAADELRYLRADLARLHYAPEPGWTLADVVEEHGITLDEIEGPVPIASLAPDAGEEG